MDLDKSGFGFQRVRTYLGPSLGWVDELVRPTVNINTGGVHTVQPGESLLLVDCAGSVTIQLPDVVKWMQQAAYQPATGFDRSITVKDFGGNAANFNIVVVPFGQQTIDNINQANVISTARAIVSFVPLIDLRGWAVQSNQGASGGGGGGDVFKAGNNTFTGINSFQSTITVPTVPAADNTQNAASTAYVQSQNYITGVSLLPYALLASPVFTGDPQAPTAGPGDNDTTIATTAFVQAAIAAGAFAPLNAEYITATGSAVLTAERVLTNTASITWDFSTPGQAKASTTAGGGNVSNSGTPTNGQLAQWTNATTIQGVSVASLGFAPIASPTFTGDPKAPTPANADNDTSIATTAFVKSTSQPLDGDLTALSALLGTNTIYYRSATDIWSPVTFSGLSFSGGVLTVTAGGGNVNNSGTPVAGQVAEWINGTTVQGVSTYAKLASPALTGTPQAPTAAAGTNNTQLANTAFVASAVGVNLKITTYLSGSGTHTFNPKMIAFQVELVGGGGGGGAAGGTGSAGGAGGDTTFGSYSATGGGGASGGTFPGPGGYANTTVACYGSTANAGTFASAGVCGAPGGTGANGPWGGGGRSYRDAGGEGGAAGSGGGGGGGAMSSTVSAPGDYSGCGGGGGGYGREFVNGMQGPYAYAVGAGGAAGASPVFAGYQGGAGGSGRIIVTEYLTR